MPTQISGSTGVPASALPFLVGQVNFFAMSTAPAGFLKCKGQAVSRTTYAALFTAIGTLYGAGDGSTTFNLPDLRGEFIRGWDDSRGVDSGRAFGSAQTADNAPHSHGVSDPGHSHTFFRQDWGAGVQSGSSYIVGGPQTTDVNSNMTGISINSAGSEGRPRNVALLACIFTGVNP